MSVDQLRKPDHSHDIGQLKGLLHETTLRVDRIEQVIRDFDGKLDKTNTLLAAIVGMMASAMLFYLLARYGVI